MITLYFVIGILNCIGWLFVSLAADFDPALRHEQNALMFWLYSFLGFVPIVQLIPFIVVVVLIYIMIKIICDSNK